MRTRFLLAAVRFVAILFAVSAACVPMSPKCHRTTFVKDGEGITGTLFRNWVDLDCTDSVAEVYCTDTTMRVVPMPGKSLGFLKKDKLVYGSQWWGCFDMPIFRRVVDVLYTIGGEVFLKTEVLSMNLALEKTTTRRLSLPSWGWNPKSKLFQIFRTRAELDTELDAELEREHEQATGAAEGKELAERRRRLAEYERAQDEAFLGTGSAAVRRPGIVGGAGAGADSASVPPARASSGAATDEPSDAGAKADAGGEPSPGLHDVSESGASADTTSTSTTDTTDINNTNDTNDTNNTINTDPDGADEDLYML